MRLILAEDWELPWHGETFRRRFEELGHQVIPFKFAEYFPRPTGGPLKRFLRTGIRAQHKLRFGPRVRRVNREFLALAEREKPDAVFLYRATLLWPSTLERIQSRGIRVAGYNNDDPFSPLQPRYVWRHLLAGVKHCDVYFAYREANLPRYRELGCPRSELLRSFYIREIHRPLADLGESPDRCDVSFTGHWEDDGREDAISAILEDPSIAFRLHGNMWERGKRFAEISRRCGAIKLAYGEDYNRILNSSRIVLSFLSRLNNDTYTRRNFEIPAAGAFMLSQHSNELATLYKEGAEAEFFRTTAEMLDKIRFYLKNEDARRRIARAGRERLLRGGHEALDRARQVVAILESLDEKS